MTTTDLDRTSVADTFYAVQGFMFDEAALLDAWNIDAWFALFDTECRYEVTPTSQDDPFELSVAGTLFLIGDDRDRLEQRVIRMNKKTAHVEYPRSKTRHLYSNVRLLEDDGTELTAAANFCTFRTKNQVTTYYPGSFRMTLRRVGGSFLIRRKRIALDLEALIPQGKVSIFL